MSHRLFCSVKLLDFMPKWKLVETFEKSHSLSMLALKNNIDLAFVKGKILSDQGSIPLIRYHDDQQSQFFDIPNTKR